MLIRKQTWDQLYASAHGLLAFQESIDWEIKMMRKMTAMLAGGLFNIRLQGRGMVAITTHYDPITLRVTPSRPVIRMFSAAEVKKWFHRT